MGDMTTALMGAYGVMLALHARDQGLSRGQVIDLALYEATLRLMDFPIPVTTGSDVKLERVGNRQPMDYALSNIFRAKDDRWVMYSAASPSVAKRVLQVVAGGDYANDPRFDDFRDLCSHEKEINERIGAWVAERSATEVVDAFTGEEAVAAIINSPEDIVRDPHILARESIIGFPGEQAKFVNVVPKLSVTPGSIQRLGPMNVGGHTLEILRDVGDYDDKSLSAFLDSKVIFQT
jgi:crotonobetainyl-CoA:carnitine CoA-transferase CaiB-like acyl-CoA transferase